MSMCEDCDLINGCRSVIQPSGDWSSKIFIIGEAPGGDEDLLGRPFCGRSGKLLDKLLLKAGIERGNVFVTNTVKCRPPANRAPTKTETATCKKWLWEELRTVNPSVIITLGKTPTCLLLKLKNTITLGEYVGKQHPFLPLPNSSVYPWYHPSFLLRKGGTYDEDTIDFFRRMKHESER